MTDTPYDRAPGETADKKEAGQPSGVLIYTVSYQFVARSAWLDMVTASLTDVNVAWRFQRHVVNRLVPTNLMANYSVMRFKCIPAGVALTYSESPVIFRPESPAFIAP